MNRHAIGALRRWPSIGVGILAITGLGLGLGLAFTGSSTSSYARVVGDLDIRVLYLDGGGAERQIVVVDHPGARGRAVGSPDDFDNVRFSPDGQWVAAVAQSEGARSVATIHIVDLKNGGEKLLDLPAGSYVSGLVWSPGSSLVALAGTESFLVSRNGEIVASAQATAVGDATFTSVTGGGYAWSPDGNYFVSIVNGDIVILRTSGKTTVVSAAELIPGAGMNVILDGWFPGDGPFHNSTNGGVIGDVGSDSVSAAPVGDKSPELSWGLKGLAPDSRSRLEEAGGGPVVWFRPISDGTAILGEVRSGDAPPRIVAITASGEPESALVTNFDARDTRGGEHVDAVVNQVH